MPPQLLHLRPRGPLHFVSCRRGKPLLVPTLHQRRRGLRRRASKWSQLSFLRCRRSDRLLVPTLYRQDRRNPCGPARRWNQPSRIDRFRLRGGISRSIGRDALPTKPIRLLYSPHRPILRRRASPPLTLLCDQTVPKHWQPYRATASVPPRSSSSQHMHRETSRKLPYRGRRTSRDLGRVRPQPHAPGRSRGPLRRNHKDTLRHLGTLLDTHPPPHSRPSIPSACRDNPCLLKA